MTLPFLGNPLLEKLTPLENLLNKQSLAKEDEVVDDLSYGTLRVYPSEIRYFQRF